MVFTPHIGKLDLYRTSGHYPYYKESQFPLIMFIRDEAYDLLEGPDRVAGRGQGGCDPEQERGAGREGGDRREGLPVGRDRSEPAVRHRAAAFPDRRGLPAQADELPAPHPDLQGEPRSYRDLPVRLAEFGTVYRFEQSGELNGMTRVRGFTQDDAHLFCTHEQVEERVPRDRRAGAVRASSTLGLNDYRVRLGLRDPDSDKYVGDAGGLGPGRSRARARSLQEMDMHFDRSAGEAAFYGPKVDFVVRDVHRPRMAARHRAARLQPARAVRARIHRRRQQAAPPGDDPPRPVRLDGAVHGHPDRALRRRVPALAGPRAGARCCRSARSSTTTPGEVISALRKERLRVEANLRAEKIGAKIRDASLQKIPYKLIIGDKEAQSRQVSVRAMGTGDQGNMSLTEFIQRCDQEIATRGATPLGSGA